MSGGIEQEKAQFRKMTGIVDSLRIEDRVRTKSGLVFEVYDDNVPMAGGSTVAVLVLVQGADKNGKGGTCLPAHPRFSNQWPENELVEKLP